MYIAKRFFLFFSFQTITCCIEVLLKQPGQICVPLENIHNTILFGIYLFQVGNLDIGQHDIHEY